MNSRTIVRSICIGAVAGAAACKEGGTTKPPTVGPPSQIVVVSGSPQTAFANLELANPIVVSIQDANGMGVAGQSVNFGIVSGGGQLTGNIFPTSDASGNVTAPAWRLGKSALPQVMRATVGTTVTKDINATVVTSFSIDVRFFGSRPISAAHQALFTDAAARLMAIVTGDVPNLSAQPVDMTPCGVTQTLNEPIDDIIIFASADSIDGKGKILGRAGPCYIRDPGAHTTITGVMQFDKDDLDDLLTSGLGQDVITHEMLHVLGVGTLWELNAPASPEVHLLQDKGTADPRYLGEQGRQGCVAVGGTVTCASNVPVEGTSATVGAGTADSHWSDKIFGNEMMTGFLNSGSNPLSSLTLRSLADLGYVVNTFDNDNYTIPGGLLRAGPSASVAVAGNWEQIVLPRFAIDRAGRIRALAPRK